MRPALLLTLLGIMLLLIIPPALWAGMVFIGFFLAFLLGGVTVCTIAAWAKDRKQQKRKQRRRV